MTIYAMKRFWFKALIGDFNGNQAWEWEHLLSPDQAEGVSGSVHSDWDFCDGYLH